MLPQSATPGTEPTPVNVQIRYTTEHGALLRSDGRTRPSRLDEIEAMYGEYVLNEMMENYGRWIDVMLPRGAIITATVNGRDYQVYFVPANEIASNYVVDADERLIILPIHAPVFVLAQALHTAAQHEPPTEPASVPPQYVREIVHRPIKLNRAAWSNPAA